MIVTMAQKGHSALPVLELAKVPLPRFLHTKVPLPTFLHTKVPLPIFLHTKVPLPTFLISLISLIFETNLVCSSVIIIMLSVFFVFDIRLVTTLNAKCWHSHWISSQNFLRQEELTINGSLKDNEDDLVEFRLLSS